MKVSLVKCPVWGTREPPLALAQLSGDLKAVGIDVRCFDLNNYLYKHRDTSFTNFWANALVSVKERSIKLYSHFPYLPAQ